MASSPVLSPGPPEAVAAGVEAVAVSTPPALERIAPEWERLWSAAHGSVFQSPAWLLPWWKHIGQGTLACVALRSGDDGALVGFAPLYVHTAPTTGRRHLFPLGIATTDRLDILVLPAWRAAVARALVGHLVASEDSWDLFEAPQLADGAALLTLRWPQGWRCEFVESEATFVLPLPAAVPRAMAQNLAYCRRRAAREGEARCELADAQSLPDWLDTLARLHARRWSLRDQPGVLSAAGVLDWHREAAPRLLAAGLLRPLRLRIAGRTVAALYVLADARAVPHRRWSYYIGGFDPGAASLSPGTLLVGHAIEQARAEGAAVFDFLRGAEPYKLRWGAAPQPMATLRAWRE